jgi:hypothetical protein
MLNSGIDFVRNPWGYRFLGSVDAFTYADDKLRPTWQHRCGYRLSDEHRRQLCIHLAAHATVSQMGGAHVYMMAVAPAGVRSWTISERKVNELGAIWGICSVSDYYPTQIEWDTDSQRYVANREYWEWEIRNQYEDHLRCHLNPPPDIKVWDRFANGVPSLEEFMARHRRVVRAQACGYLAGHVADGITAGMGADEALRLYDRRDTQHVGGGSDIVIAEGLAGLLPAGEYENAVRITEEVLRRPEVWKSVNQLGGELVSFGLLEGDDCEADMRKLLPKVQPSWPPAPVQASATPTP